MELSTAAIRDIYENKISVAELRKETYKNTQDIDVITKPIKYEEFFLEYLLPNRPCILDTWVTDGWRSRKEWVLEDGQPNLELIKTLFGDYWRCFRVVYYPQYGVPVMMHHPRFNIMNS